MQKLNLKEELSELQNQLDYVRRDAQETNIVLVGLQLILHR